jgi:ankyrin repeat protein/nucleoside phosphorylase
MAPLCALPVELAAAQAMLDDPHQTPRCPSHDPNLYSCGRVGEHNVVITCLPEGRTGTNSAAAVAVQMRSTFSSMRFSLMVGIGGGVPSVEADVRLGDVVVSTPYKTYGGVVQYHFGKTKPDRFERTGALNAPPQVLLGAVTMVRAKKMGGTSRLLEYLAKLDSQSYFSREAAGLDTLFEAGYDHMEGEATCVNCKMEHAVTRKARKQEVEVHHGTIASDNLVMRSAAERDRISAELGGVLCFEMEGAGLMNIVPCLVVRGICDYADSHKNKRWQPYAAATAAAYAKVVLSAIPSHEVDEIPLGTSPSPSNPTESQLPRTILAPNARKQVKESLRFLENEYRFHNIQRPHSDTCKWLLTNDHYMAWLDDKQIARHHGLLWLKGKPGSGKSTMMKFALLNAQACEQEDVHISFFFNARGSPIEKSTEGVYRQLLLQLFNDLPKTQQAFDDFPADYFPKAPNYKWQISQLENLLEKAIGKIGQSRLWVYIDALDECDEEQVRGMVTFLTSCLETHGIGMRLFFASRPYPNIDVRNKLELNLDGEREHTHDIERYVQKEFGAKNDPQNQYLQRIQNDIVERASGVFIWVVLVVQILNKERDGGRNVQELERTLRDIHKDLGELFRSILDKNDEDVESTRLCFRLLLFSARSLSREELYFAIQSGRKQDIVALERDGDINTETMDAFILHCSKGLAELTASVTVQFIHETIREFLLKDGAGYVKGGDVEAPSVGHAHDRLTQCCINYVKSLERAVSHQIWNGEYSPELRQKLYSLMPRYPFMGYALWEVLYHADASEAGGVPQHEFLQNLKIQGWISLYNFWEGRKYEPNASLLYVLTDRNFLSLLRTTLQLGLYTDVDSGPGPSPLRLTLDWGRDDALKLLLTPSAGDDSEIDPPSEAELWQLNYDFHSRPAELRHSSMTEIIYTIGDEPSLLALIRSGRCGHPERLGSSLLAFAAQRGYDTIMELLLGRENPDLESTDSSGFTPLARAAQAGRVSCVELLLDQAAINVDAQCSNKRTALSYAVSEGHEVIVRLLLQQGSSVDRLDEDDDKTPLMYAALSGSRDILMHLISQTPEISIQSKTGFTALAYAAFKGHEDIVEELLRQSEIDANRRGLEKKKIDVNLWSKVHKQTPLMLALKDKSWHIANMILNHTQIDVSIRDKNERSASDYLVNGFLAYKEDGRVNQTIELREAMSGVACKLLPPEHPQRLEWQHDLALAYQADDQVQKAKELLEAVFEIKEGILPPEDPSLESTREALQTVCETLADDPGDVSAEEFSDSSFE